MDINLFKSETEKAISLFVNSYATTLIGGDFNAKCMTWGNPMNNIKGIFLEKAMNDYGYVCLNDGTHTFGTATTQLSVLDVTFMNKVNINITWKVLDEQITNSNHAPVRIDHGKDLRIFSKKKMLNKKKCS